MGIKNQIALVTGAASGLGFAYATELLRNEAAHVAILDLKNSNGAEAANKLNGEFGEGKAIFVVCDVTVPEELEAGFAKTVEKFGGLNIVINNAGIMDDSRWELMVQINYVLSTRFIPWPTYRMLSYCGLLLGMRYMGKDNGGEGGTIVNVSSIVGIFPSSVFPIYCGTKHAVIGLSRSFAQPYHYERTGVRVLTMCPGATDTQLMSESIGRTLDIVSEEHHRKDLSTYLSQTVDDVAQGMMHIIRIGETGSVWMVRGGNPIYQVRVPDVPIKKN